MNLEFLTLIVASIFPRAVSSPPSVSFIYSGRMVGFEGDYGLAPFESKVRESLLRVLESIIVLEV